jgi:hypothetical protein
MFMVLAIQEFTRNGLIMLRGITVPVKRTHLDFLPSSTVPENRRPAQRRESLRSLAYDFPRTKFAQALYPP